MITRLGYMTVEQLAVELRLSESSIYRLLKLRKIPGAMRLGANGSWRIDRDQIEKWIADQQAAYRTDGHQEAKKRTRSGMF